MTRPSARRPPSFLAEPLIYVDFVNTDRGPRRKRRENDVRCCAPDRIACSMCAPKRAGAKRVNACPFPAAWAVWDAQAFGGVGGLLFLCDRHHRAGLRELARKIKPGHR